MGWGHRLGFLATGLALHLGLCALYSVPVLRNHKAVRSDELFLAGPRDVDVLVVGDSHPRTDIQGPVLGPRVANIAFGGTDAVKTWYRTEALVRWGDKRVGTLIVPMDPASFSPWRVDAFTPELVWGRYVDWAELGALQGDPLKYLSHALKAWLVPYAGELRTFNQMRRKKFGFGDDLPNADFSRRSAYERADLAQREALDHLQHDTHAHPLLLWGFRSLVAWADERGMDVVAISFPITREYAAEVDRTTAWQEVEEAALKPFLAASDRHVWLDHRATYDAHPEAFSDPHHLNATGRAFFSQRLRRELVARGLLPDRPAEGAEPADGE